MTVNLEEREARADAARAGGAAVLGNAFARAA